MSGYASLVEDCRQLVLAKLEDLNGLDKHMVLQEIVKELSEESDIALRLEYMLVEEYE